jgi:hypothetical protein
MERRKKMMAGAGPIEIIFERAEKDNRNFLLEDEVYALLRAFGIAAPRFFFVRKGERATWEKLSALRSDQVVLKIVSPRIVHKSDVGGVAFVANTVSEVNRAIARMLAEVPVKLAGTDAGGPDIRGVLVLEKVAFEKLGFGSELLLGIRNSREFGPVVIMGLGGLDVEYVNERLKEKTAVAIGSAHLLRRDQIEGLLEPLAFYDKLVNGFRGKPAPVSRDVLVQAFDRFRRLAAHFSPYSRKSAFVIEEAEVNPFVVRDGALVPLDGMCRFSGRRGRASPPASSSSSTRSRSGSSAYPSG